MMQKVQVASFVKAVQPALFSCRKAVALLDVCMALSRCKGIVREHKCDLQLANERFGQADVWLVAGVSK